MLHKLNKVIIISGVILSAFGPSAHSGVALGPLKGNIVALKGQHNTNLNLI